MGDAYCGPSNPLQNFQKHTSADRSVQQDRLAQRRQNAPLGFRSNQYLSGAGPSAMDQLMEQDGSQQGPQGWMSPEQQMAAAGGPMAAADFHRQAPPPPPATSFGGPMFNDAAASPSWARDFQNLSLEPGMQRPQQWANSFQQNHARQGSPLAQAPIAAQPAFQQSFNNFSPMGGYQMPLSQPQFQQPMDMSSKGKERVEDYSFDEAAFARAFEQAAADALQKQPATETRFERMPEEEELAVRAPTETEMGAASNTQVETAQIINQDSAQEWSEAYRRQLVDELESETLLAQAQLDEQLQKDRAVEEAGGQLDRDEDLANTARELLEKVQHDQDEKFQQSEFLSLMRRFRDGAATIRHGQMQDGVEGASAEPQIPFDEQDHDSGRGAHMSGALPSSSSSSWAETTAPARPSSVDPNDLSARANWREQFGRHPVDDF